MRCNVSKSALNTYCFVMLCLRHVAVIFMTSDHRPLTNDHPSESTYPTPAPCLYLLLNVFPMTGFVPVCPTAVYTPPSVPPNSCRCSPTIRSSDVSDFPCLFCYHPPFSCLDRYMCDKFLSSRVAVTQDCLDSPSLSPSLSRAPWSVSAPVPCFKAGPRAERAVFSGAPSPLLLPPR